MVHYRPYAEPGDAPLVPACQAAIVVAVHPSSVDPGRLTAAELELMPGPLVTLCVFTPDGPRMHDAEQDERVAAGGGTWHWPRRT
jgi:hypothetical protein